MSVFYFYLSSSRCLNVHLSKFLSVSVWISVSMSGCTISGCMDVCVSIGMSLCLSGYGLSVLMSGYVSLGISVYLDVSFSL